MITIKFDEPRYCHYCQIHKNYNKAYLVSRTRTLYRVACVLRRKKKKWEREKATHEIEKQKKQMPGKLIM